MASVLKVSPDIWHLEPSITSPDTGHKIDWNSFMSSGATDPKKCLVLKESLKKYFLARYGPDNSRGVDYGSATMAQEFSELQRLARWMVSQNIYRFSKLAPNDVSSFLKSRRARNNGRAPLAERTLMTWLSRFEDLWAYRGDYEDALAFDPGSVRDEVLALVPTRHDRPWSALTEEVAYKLIQCALRWVVEVGPQVIVLLQERARLQCEWSGKHKGLRDAAVAKAYDEIEASDRYRILRDELADPSIRRGDLISKAVAMTEGACIVMLLFLVGMRISELLALQKDCLLHDDPDGFGEITYIKGVAAKQRGRSRRWVAASPLDEVIRLLIGIDSLKGGAPSDSGALFRACRFSYKTDGPMPSGRRLSPDLATSRLRGFARFSLGENLSIARMIHPHMARKTFAQFAVRRDKSILEPVSAHLGHVYKSFTDGKYVGVDHSLSQMLVEADRQELATGLESLLTSKHISGGAAESLKELRAKVTKFRGKRTLTALVNSLIKQGVVLAPCDWGYCVYTKALSACGGDQLGPNESNRSPDVCSGCKNFAVTEEHVHWWQARERRETDFLKRKDLPEQTVAFVSRRLERTRAVLKRAVWHNQLRVNA